MLSQISSLNSDRVDYMGAMGGRVTKKESPNVKYKKIFFSETTGQNSLKLHRNDP